MVALIGVYRICEPLLACSSFFHRNIYCDNSVGVAIYVFMKKYKKNLSELSMLALLKWSTDLLNVDLIDYLLKATGKEFLHCEM